MTTVEVRSEPLTYRQDTRHSYFRDLLFRNEDDGARSRLERHGQEMAQVQEYRDAGARRRFAAEGIEYRVEPSTIQGQGGYFTPPLWLIQQFATANRPGRVLSGLIPTQFTLPAGVSSINVPVVTTGTTVGPTPDNGTVPDTDLVDAAGTSDVVMLSGDGDVAVQLLEQSPAGAHLDWAFYKDLSEAYDADLEAQLLNGTGQANQQLQGAANVTNIISVTFTSAGPTGVLMWPALGQVFAQIGDGRMLPPEVWLARSARWAWFMGQESTTQNLPFGVLSPFFLGDTPNTPDPVGAWFGLPVFLDDAILANLGATANQDQIFCLRPSDMVLFEGTPHTDCFREPGSGNLMARLQFRNYAAAVTNRRPAGIGVVGGTGMVVQSGY